MHHVTCFTFQPFKKIGCHYGPWAPMHSCLFTLKPFAEKRRDNKISEPKMSSLHQKLTVKVQIKKFETRGDAPKTNAQHQSICFLSVHVNSACTVVMSNWCIPLSNQCIPL